VKKLHGLFCDSSNASFKLFKYGVSFKIYATFFNGLRDTIVGTVVLFFIVDAISGLNISHRVNSAGAHLSLSCSQKKNVFYYKMYDKNNDYVRYL